MSSILREITFVQDQIDEKSKELDALKQKKRKLLDEFENKQLKLDLFDDEKISSSLDSLRNAYVKKTLL